MKIVVAAFLGFIVGALVMGSIHNLLAAGEASKNKRSLAEARNIIEALQKYRMETGSYPPLDGGLQEAESLLVPRFATHIWLRDVYNRPYLACVDRDGPVVVSTGRNGFVVTPAKVDLPADGSFGQ